MEEKKWNAGSIGLTFAGSFLGAGYVSGQELWQFFGSFGGGGRLGVLAAMALLAVFGLAMPVLYFTGLAHSLVGAVVPSILAVATLAGMAVFGDRTIKNEFRRRLHF